MAPAGGSPRTLRSPHLKCPQRIRVLVEEAWRQAIRTIAALATRRSGRQRSPTADLPASPTAASARLPCLCPMAAVIAVPAGWPAPARRRTQPSSGRTGPGGARGSNPPIPPPSDGSGLRFRQRPWSRRCAGGAGLCRSEGQRPPLRRRPHGHLKPPSRIGRQTGAAVISFADAVTSTNALRATKTSRGSG
jgi:hypothetical protein